MILIAILLWLVVMAGIALLMDARRRDLTVRERLAAWFEDLTR